MILTDTHTHLYSDQFDIDRDKIILNAIDNGITRFFVPAIDSAYYPGMFELESKYPDNIFLMAGLHPTHVKNDYIEEFEFLVDLLSQRKFYAVGEIGIDLYWDKSFLKEQQDVFKKQILLAKAYGLPIVIHCREAFDEIFEILEEEKDEQLFGIFHCFTGTYEQAIRAISLGMKLGIGGVVTFKNGKIDKFLNDIPLEQIVLETDSPYLAPAPFRGRRNESSYLTYIVEKLVDIYNIPPSDIARITTQNSMDIFRK